MKKGRIIEIAILVHDGLTVIDKFTSLINPECYISPLYTRISGITNEMVEDAPKFHEIAKDILRLTEDRIFVAHNVNFDYGFIQEEFASLGYKYRRDTLCTVRLSRKLIPGKVSYSLGNLCASLDIEIENRHRAEGDAVATVKLFDLLLQIKSEHPTYRRMDVHEIMARKLDKIKEYVLKKLPEECGVYYFRNQEGEIIYIGKSTNMFNRAKAHFNNDQKKARQMLNELNGVDYHTTGSEIVALLLESREIKKHQPKYNRRTKAEEFSHSLDWSINKAGIIHFKIVSADESEQSLLLFTSYLSARNTLDLFIEEHTLCLHHCSAELAHEDSTCFNYQIKKCRGVCAGEEAIGEYNLRARRIVAANSYPANHFFIIEPGREPDEKSLILVCDNKYYGYAHLDQSDSFSNLDELKDLIKPEPYYPDQDNLLRSWIIRKKIRIQRM